MIFTVKEIIFIQIKDYTNISNYQILATKPEKKYEDFSDMINRVYPNDFQFTKERVLARTFTLQVVTHCNLCCTYCYQINKSHHTMTWNTAKKAIDELLNNSFNKDAYFNIFNSSGLIIEFIGGEPFLAIDLIDRISKYVVDRLFELNHPWKNKIRFSICTNGILYFDPKVQEYIHKYNTLLSLSISIDGNKELHDSCRVDEHGNGSYDRAMKAVNHYRSVFHGAIGSKMTICPENLQYLSQATISLIENDYTDINANCVYEEGWTNDHATQFYYQLKEIADYLIRNNLYHIRYSPFEERGFHPKDKSDLENWCGGTGVMLSYDYKGDAYPCIRYMESSLGNSQVPMIIGNLEHGIGHTKKEKQYLKQLRRITRKSQSTKECFNCPIADLCSWCSAYNYQMFGTPNKRATYICQMHKARALANCYYWNIKYLSSPAETNRMKVFYNFVPKEWALEIIDEEEFDKLEALQRRDLFEIKQ